MRIQFDYNWHTPDKTVIRFAARDNWTWKDFHAVVHASQFAVMNQPHPVHVLIDFSTGQRDRFPSGANAHATTFGKRHNEAFSGNAVVIGMPSEVIARMGITESRQLTTKDGIVQFVADQTEADAILATWEEKS